MRSGGRNWEPLCYSKYFKDICCLIISICQLVLLLGSPPESLTYPPQPNLPRKNLLGATGIELFQDSCQNIRILPEVHSYREKFYWFPPCKDFCRWASCCLRFSPYMSNDVDMLLMLLLQAFLQAFHQRKSLMRPVATSQGKRPQQGPSPTALQTWSAGL